MAAALAGFVALPFALVVLIAALAPERFPFVLPVGYVLLVMLPTVTSVVIFTWFVLDHRKRCDISPEGIELWTLGHEARRLTWDEVASVHLARYTMRIYSVRKPYIHHLPFVDRNTIAQHIPEMKRKMISQL